MDEFGFRKTSYASSAVLKGFCDAAVVTDIGGESRISAVTNGLIAFKSTFGLVSRYGISMSSSSLEQVAIVTKDVKQVAEVLNVIAGHDSRDSNSADIETKNYVNELGEAIKDLKIGYIEEFIEGNEYILDIAKKYQDMGASVSQCKLEFDKYLLATYYILSSAEASSNLARYDGIRYGHRTQNYKGLKDIYINSRGEGFGEEVKRRNIFGTYFLTDNNMEKYYNKANKVRTLIKRKLDELFKDFDILLIPAVNTNYDKVTENHPVYPYIEEKHTCIANLGGLPVISIPCGENKGFELIGRHYEESTVLNAAYAYKGGNE
ncbi:MAG: amidase family protein [Clostridia bacterium]|nr:amidase family protein [Clostridia bacterium]